MLAVYGGAFLLKETRYRFSMRVAAIQLCSQDDVETNLSAAGALVRQAAAEGADLLVLPEGFAYLGRDEGRQFLAEEAGAGGPIETAVSSWSRELGVHIIAGGMPEVSTEPARPFNSSLLFDPQGVIIARYRKLHLFDVSLSDGTAFRESRATSPGSAPVVADIGDIRVGMSICYDVRFAPLYGWQRNQGAHLLTVPAAFTKTTGAAHWEVLLRARAIETQCWLVAAAQEGEHPHGRKTYGQSMIVDPWGNIVAQKLHPGSGFVLADIDMQALHRVRTQIPVEEHELFSKPRWNKPKNSE